MVPVFAIALTMCCGARRRYLFEHFVFATHAFTFWMVMMIALVASLIVVFVVLSLFGRVLVPSDGWGSLAVGVVFAAYLFLAWRRAYGGSLPANVVRAVILSCSMLPILQLYRVIYV